MSSEETGGEVEVHHTPDGDDRGRSAPGMPTRSSRALPWLCLDSTHSCCSTCTAPPPPGVEVVLLSGRKWGSGEARLRSLIAALPAWRDAALRTVALRSCVGNVSLSSLAEVLSGNKSESLLRTSDMLHLARVWRFRSDVWRPVRDGVTTRAQVSTPRGEAGGSSKRPRLPVAPATAPPAPRPARISLSAEEPASQAQAQPNAMHTLRRLALLCGSTAAGEKARLAAAMLLPRATRLSPREPWAEAHEYEYVLDAAPDDAHITPTLLAAAGAEAAEWRNVAWALQDCIAPLATWSEGEAGGDTPAWAALRGRELPQDAIMRQMASLAGSDSTSVTLEEGGEAQSSAAASAASSAAAIYDKEVTESRNAMLALLAHCGSLSARLRLTTLSCYQQGAQQVLEAICLAANSAAHGWAQRCEWMSALLEAREAATPSLALSSHPFALFPRAQTRLGEEEGGASPLMIPHGAAAGGRGAHWE